MNLVESNPLPQVAIIGIGCRLPGDVHGPRDLWQLLRNGTDAIRDVPPDRWSLTKFYHPDAARPGKTYARAGGFLRDVTRFDARFFGVSPREAEYMDPQHRILLEVAWEALEDAGLPLPVVSRANTGVFVGISTYDYAAMQVADVFDRRGISAYTNVGGALSIAANRLSYHLDLRGPSMIVDTACSSSLVAVHLAYQSLARGECDHALVGGINIMLRPEGSIGFSKASMLAPDCRCKAFDARADGYVRAEGAAVVVLKPLARAVADGDQIYAVIRGTHVNQDGRTAGIAFPNPDAQARMLEQAYRQAGVSPREVHYVEAHGTGTPAGDPIELDAIGRVVGAGRSPGESCVVGSIKTNIGHLEAASGVTGLIKTALALHHGQIPAHLHFENPNPKIPFDTNGLRVPRALEDWPQNGRARIAGVNSFGFGGTNAHAILEGYSRTVPGSRASSGAHLLLISTATEETLVELARKYAELLRDPTAKHELADVCYSAALRRTQLPQRLAVTGRDANELAERLEAFTRGETRPTMSTGRAPSTPPKTAWVFSGMGQQWFAMGRELRSEEPAFARALEKCSALFERRTGWSLLEALSAPEASSRIQETAFAQPAIFAIQVALVTLLRSWGLEPSAVVGHSVGEAAAAWAAGALSLEDAVTLIYHRSRLQSRIAGAGGMIAVEVSLEDLGGILAGRERRVSIAAINGPKSITLSGDTEAINALAAELESKGVFFRHLRVEVPYHSHLMAPLEAELLESLAGLRPATAQIRMISSVTGQNVEGSELNAEYWWRNIRQPVVFSDALRALAEGGIETFLEIGAHPVLEAAISASASSSEKPAAIAHTLRRGEPERATLLGALGRLHGAGVSFEMREVFGRRTFVRLPTYAWGGERYFREAEGSRIDRLGEHDHPLLGRRLGTAAAQWELELDAQQVPYLADHIIQDAIVFPAAAYVEMAFAAATKHFGQEVTVIDDVVLERVLIIPANDSVLVHVSLDEAGEIVFTSRRPGEKSWTRNAIAHVRRGAPRSSQPSFTPISIPGAITMSGDHCYERLAAGGLSYGPAFKGVQRVQCGPNSALADIGATVPAEELARYFLHPTFLDAAFQVFIGAITEGRARDSAGLFLPVRLGRIRRYARPTGDAVATARVYEKRAHRIRGRVDVFDLNGTPIASIDGFECKALDSGPNAKPGYYEHRWHIAPREEAGLRSAPPPFLPPPHQLVALLDHERAAIVSRMSHDRLYEIVEPLSNALVCGYVVDALIALGWNQLPPGPTRVEELCSRLSIKTDHLRFAGALLEYLVEDGLLSRAQGEICVAPLTARADTREQWRTMWNEFPAGHAEIMLVRRCGESLAAVLRGEVDPLQLIFVQGSTVLAEHLYQDGPSFRAYNTFVQTIVQKALQHLPEGRRLDIVEVGGGTGGLASYLLPILPRDHTRYIFTDIGLSLVSEAEQKFTDFPFVEYRALDLEKDPLAQGFEAHQADLIVAADVLHATRDLKVSLRNVRKILRPGGALLLVEGTNTKRWATLVFGMLKGWWAFEDLDVRTNDPWLPEEGWKQLLLSEGFDLVAATTDHAGRRGLHTVFVARNGASSEPSNVETIAPRTNEAAAGEGEAIVLLADSDGVAARLASRLGDSQIAPIIVRRGEKFARVASNVYEVPADAGAGFAHGLEAVLEDWPQCRHIVDLWPLDAREAGDGPSLARANLFGPLTLLQMVKTLVRQPSKSLPTITVVTAGVHAVTLSDRTVAAGQAGLWGMGRVVHAEHPELCPQLIDLSAAIGEDEVGELAAELIAAVRAADRERAAVVEEGIALRGKSRFVMRLERIRPEEVARREPAAPEAVAPPFRVEIPVLGSIADIEMRQMERRPPGPGEVEIETTTAALNFKDLMVAMGLLPDDALGAGYVGAGLGLECAGRITAIGPGETHLKIGDPVIAFVLQALATHVTCDARFVWRAPDQVSLEEAATIPAAFLTAAFALRKLARLQPRERVLIHAATGGVGLAAVQIAQQIGAEVFATAGSPLKRELLAALGVKHVMDSRSLSFVDDVLERTGGEGVDVVVNSLSGEFLTQSVGLLRSYGRFVEIGKRDIYQNSKLGLIAFRRNLSFTSLDMDEFCSQRPREVIEMLAELLRDFERGALHPLAHRVYPAARIKAAFRHMAQGKHIGKVLVSLADRAGVVPLELPRPMKIHGDATYLITGGLGGLGLEVARGLMDRGARHLVLLGRSGASTEGAKKQVESMLAEGFDVKVFAADVANESRMREVFSETARTMPPLRGIIHAAMVLDDGLITQLDVGRFSAALEPKMTGAINLDRLSRELPLDFFVLFSSFTTLVGNPGQANYVAANSFLESLAWERRARGLPALTINWGPVAGAGYVSRTAGLGKKLEQWGIRSMPVGQVVQILFDLLALPNVIQVGVSHTNWAQYGKLAGGDRSARVAHLVGPASSDEANTEASTLLSSVLAAGPDERRKLVLGYLRERLARVLGMAPAAVDPDLPVIQIGLDSLMALELKNRIGTDIGIDVPTVKFLEGMTLSGLAEFLVGQISARAS